MNLEAEFNYLTRGDPLTRSVPNVPVPMLIHGDDDKCGVVVGLLLSDGGIDKRKGIGKVWEACKKPYPFFLKLLFAFRDYFVLVLVRKQVRAHSASSVSQKLMSQTLWEK